MKHIVFPLHELAVGRSTRRYLGMLEASQWWATDRLRDFQRQKLRGLLLHAHARCPYYRQRIDEAGVDPARITLDQLSRLPTLSKADILEHAEGMIDPTIRGGLMPCTTGGSTGTPLAFKVDRGRQAADQAARARTRRWFGIDIGERELYLWGSPVEHGVQDRIKTIRDGLMNHRLLDAFCMTPGMMSRYLGVIRRFDPVHIFGYPSSIARLARHAAGIGGTIRSRSLKAVFTTGELFQPADRAVIAEHVTVSVADGYGAREAGFIAHQCPAGSYHVSMESLIVELLDATGRPVSRGEHGEIVVTHLDARGMPFIRYRTGDVGRWSAGEETPKRQNAKTPRWGKVEKSKSQKVKTCGRRLSSRSAEGSRDQGAEGPRGQEEALGTQHSALSTSSSVLGPASACPCGRGLESLEIIAGRQTDMLRTTAGGYAHALSVIYVLRDEPAVKEFKIVQRPNLDLDVSVVPQGQFDQPQQQRVAELLKGRIGRGIEVRIRLAREIPPEPSGKHRYVVSQARELTIGD